MGDPVEDGDLIPEVGKSYMRSLVEAAQDPKMPEKFYIMVAWEKTPMAQDRTISLVFIKRRTIPAMEPATDVYFVNKRLEQLELLWSLPEYIRMGGVVEHPEDYDPQTVSYVQKYKELEAKSKKRRRLL